MKLISKPTTFQSIWDERLVDLGGILKIVVDLEQQLIGVDAEMHADIEEEMLKQGSQQRDLWGANLLENSEGTYDIEYTSFINIRPGQGNRAMDIEDGNIRQQMETIIHRLIL